MSLGDYLKTQRKNKDWSQRDLAEASGISNAEISRLESGVRKEPSPSILKSLSTALGIPYEDMMRAAGFAIDESPSLQPSSKSLPQDLTEEELKDVYKYIEFIRSQRT